MIEITILHRIEAPDVTAALNNLADALKARSVAAPVVQYGQRPDLATDTLSAPETPAQAAMEIPTPVPQPTPVPAPAPVEAPVSAPATKVYTFEDITAAGSQLLEMNKMSQLMELLKGYGVQAVTQLKPEQYAAVAAGLRGLGAKI